MSVFVFVFLSAYIWRILYYSEQLIEFITTPMGNAIPAGPVINSVSVWCAKRLRKQINPHANDEKETRQRKKGRKERMNKRERERLSMSVRGETERRIYQGNIKLSNMNFFTPS